MTQDTAIGRSWDAASPAGAVAPVIVVGLDGSPTSWDAFCWAAGQAVRAKGKLIAVYVMPWIEPVVAFGVPLDYAGVEQARQDVADTLKGEAAQRARDLGISVRFVGEYGDVTHALSEVARTEHANLVVVGRSAKLLHHLAGSLSHRLISRNDAPVVVVVP
jgi:nucleotide-binding universal stress UspA family protein